MKNINTAQKHHNKANIENILHKIKHPIYILEEAKLRHNLEILDSIQQQSGAKILVALKGFAFWSSFKLVSKYLDGITASGIYEARLGLEEFRKYNSNAEIAVFSPAFTKKEIKKLRPFANHIIFNSFSQFGRLKHLLKDSKISIGLRINPMYSQVTPPIYNPCIKGSRLGITPSEFKKGVEKYSLDEISGIHFHTHCEQNSDALEKTLEYVEKYFGKYLKTMKWINFGGGHHITRCDYDTTKLINIIKAFKKSYNNIDIYLEPGEAVGWQCGVLVGEVVDIIYNGYHIAITNLSAAAHMPDCLEMPYTPQIRGARIITQDSIDIADSSGQYHYRLGSPSCLAGDVIGDYIFDRELSIGDKIIVEDMIHYTIVKNNTFNGIPLPSLGILKENGKLKILKKFGYKDYKRRNG